MESGRRVAPVAVSLSSTGLSGVFVGVEKQVAVGLLKPKLISDVQGFP